MCANVGDSRAIVGRFQHGKWMSKSLSFDHKPDNAAEMSRIEASGGYVRTYMLPDNKPVGPARVWVRGSNPPIPGLAMSRSFGDWVASSVGVSSDPEIMAHSITSEDKFILIASDGVWEFLSNSA